MWHRLKDYRLTKHIKQKYESKLVDAHFYIKHNRTDPLTSNEIDEVNAYWRQYGINLQDLSWHTHYSSIKGFDVRYIPNEVYAYVIWPYYNNKLFTNAIDDANYFQLAWRDKNYFERFLEDIPFPHVYFRKINGRFYDKDYKSISISALLNTCKGQTVIVKDAWDSGEGRGVKKYKVENEADVEQILKSYAESDNFIVQECIKQQEFFSRFNKDSVNVIRLNTMRINDEIRILNATIRIGIEGSITDVSYVNGVETCNVLGITETGFIMKETFNQYGEKSELAEEIVVNGKVPRWEEIVQLAVNGHLQLQHFDIVGWDFIVDSDNEVKCIEYNIQRPGTVFYQYAHGPFFGKYTDDVLAFLKDKRNQGKYIPKWMRS